MGNCSYRQIAREAGVSVTTVHRILTGANKEIWQSSLARAERIRSIARKYGFRPNAAARAMKKKKTDILAVVLKIKSGVTTMDSGIFEMITGISTTLENNGYMLNLVRVWDNFDINGIAPRAFRENLLEGVIVIGNMPEYIYKYIRSLYKNSVFLETNYFAEENCIRRDEISSVRFALDALMEKGRKKIFYIGPQPESSDSHFSEKIRLEAFISLASERKIDYEVIRSIERDPFRSEEFIKSLNLPNKDIGLLLYDTDHAMRLVMHAMDFRFRPGKDFGIACCDGSMFANMIWPKLSRSTVSRYDFGADAAQMLLELVSNKKTSVKSRLIIPRFIKGESA